MSSRHWVADYYFSFYILYYLVFYSSILLLFLFFYFFIVLIFYLFFSLIKGVVDYLFLGEFGNFALEKEIDSLSLINKNKDVLRNVLLSKRKSIFHKIRIVDFCEKLKTQLFNSNKFLLNSVFCRRLKSTPLYNFFQIIYVTVFKHFAKVRKSN
jgi:hypothetical protein